MGRPLRATVRLCMTVIAAVSAAGCAGGGSTTPGAASTLGSKPYSLEQIAARTDCRIQPQGNAAGFRQGACQSRKGRFVVLTFSTSKAGEDWLKEARNWGGTYLVGTRWVIVGTPQQLQSFRARLGGDIQVGDDHSGHAATPATG
jgi:hypothetical protein